MARLAGEWKDRKACWLSDYPGFGRCTLNAARLPGLVDAVAIPPYGRFTVRCQAESLTAYDLFVAQTC